MARRLVAQDETSKRHERHAPKTNFGASFPLSHHTRRETPFLPAAANSHSKGGARPPFDVLKYTQKQRGTNKMKERLHPVKAQNVQTVTESKDSDKPGSTQKGLVAHVHSSFCDTEALLASSKPTTRPHAFISWHNISKDALPNHSSKQ